MELGMVELLNDETLFLNEVAKLLDCETGSARRKRDYRSSHNAAGDNVPQLSPGCRQEKEIEKETESEIEPETEKEVSTEPEGSVCRTKDVRRTPPA